MNMKKSMMMFVLILLVFTTIAQTEQQQQLAEDAAAVTAECGLWCKVSEFFWGSSEARAGMGWFD